MNTWSWSRLRSYVECPAQYEFKYLSEAPQEPVPGFEFGRRMHEAIEQYTLHCYQAGVSRDHGYALAMAAGEDDPRLQRVLEWMADILTFRHDLVYTEGEAVERWFEVDMPCGDRFAGKIDLVQYDSATGRWLLTDYKSGFVADESDRPPRQLLAYAQAWRAVVGDPDARFRLQLLYPEVNPVYGENLVEWYVKPSELSWDWIEVIVEQVKAATKFPARPGGHCNYCPFLTTVCPYRDRLVRPVDELRTNADRLEMKRQMEYHRAAYKRLLAQLQEDCRARGPIDTPDGPWGWHYPQGETVYQLPSRRANPDADAELYEALGGEDGTTLALLRSGLLAFNNEKVRKAAAEAKPLASDREPDLIDRIFPHLEPQEAKPKLGLIKDDAVKAGGGSTND